MEETLESEFDLTPLARVCAAIAIAFLSAAEAAILSVPVSFFLSKRHPTPGEFGGIAFFGYLVVVGGATAAVGFVAVFAFVVTRRKTAGWINMLAWTLLAAVITAVVTIALVGGYGSGFFWAVGVSATVLTVGLVRVWRSMSGCKSKNSL